MFNKKVYLAKSNLASGFDFEYVKSNLLRIPDIEIIEYGDGPEPSECACFVYIPNSAIPFADVLPVNKNSFFAIDSFIKGFEGGKNLPVFTYTGQDDTWDDEDVEDSLPMANPFEELFEVDKDSWDGYGQLVINTQKDESLLHVINSLLTGSSRNTWRHNTRHHMPKKEYAMPPIPTFEQRRSKGTVRHQSVEESEEGFSQFLRRTAYKKEAARKVKDIHEEKLYKVGSDYDVNRNPCVEIKFSEEKGTTERIKHSNLKSQRRK
jgi:hypothetical protein